MSQAGRLGRSAVKIFMYSEPSNPGSNSHATQARIYLYVSLFIIQCAHHYYCLEVSVFFCWSICIAGHIHIVLRACFVTFCQACVHGGVRSQWWGEMNRFMMQSREREKGHTFIFDRPNRSTRCSSTWVFLVG